LNLLPRTLNRKRIYILPTRHGFLFILILFAMLLGSMNYNNNLGFLLTFLLGSMAFISVLHTFRNLSGIQIVSVRTKPVFAHEAAVFEFLVRADSHERIAVSFAFRGAEETRVNLLPNEDNRISVRIAAKQRGILEPGRLSVFSIYPLGLFRAWSKVDSDAECLIYPKPLFGVFHSANEAFSADGKEAEGKSRSGTDDFEGLKSYQPGDPLRRISWKSFSRGRGLFVKNFEGGTQTRVVLDWHHIKDTDTERKLSRLCDMVLKANRLNMDYGLKLPGKTVAPGKGESHKYQCLKALALFEIVNNEQ
jgi:uncharacterized protein (DUF58 family)